MTFKQYNELLAQWLRDLADAVEAAEVVAEDVAQALFCVDDYTVPCPLAEAQTPNTHALIRRAEAIYPVPELTGPSDPTDARWEQEQC